MKHLFLIAAVVASTVPAFAQEDESGIRAMQQQAQEAIEVAFASAQVSSVVAAAEVSNSVDANTKAKAEAIATGYIDCAVNPKPFRQVDKSKCLVTGMKAYGWYADPSLVINVKAFVSASKVLSGKINASDIQISEITVTKPDPTGLE